MKKTRNKPHKKPRKRNEAKGATPENGGEDRGEASKMINAQEVNGEIQIPDPTMAGSSRSAADGAGAVAARRVGFLTFIRQVRAEMARVTWPTRNETIVTTIMVFIMVTLAALFFLLADQVLSFAVAWILGAR